MDYSKVKVLVITGVGLNCERETTAAFSTCGATVEQVHLNDILDGKRSLSEFHILAFIGGFFLRRSPWGRNRIRQPGKIQVERRFGKICCRW